ncbi:uncharacterized protein VTP21DRAFT_4002 [Calcarisporiella thermophila]|uniref:uncharacterized protein n=1 Tax=Calcarisporiella thermophila TaxID=911321 RepID=UPI003744A536
MIPKTIVALCMLCLCLVEAAPTGTNSTAEPRELPSPDNRGIGAGIVDIALGKIDKRVNEIDCFGNDMKIEGKKEMCYSAFAYCSTAMKKGTKYQKIENLFSGGRFVPIVEGDAEGYVGKSGNTVVVSFAGTNTYNPFYGDAWADLKSTSKTDYINSAVDINIIVGEGFHDHVNAIYKPTLDAIKKYFRPGDELVITGHSLGGAMAQIMAAKMKLDGDMKLNRGSTLPSPKVVTFGQPVAGNTQFANMLDRDMSPDSIRYYNDRDTIVAKAEHPNFGDGKRMNHLTCLSEGNAPRRCFWKHTKGKAVNGPDGIDYNKRTAHSTFFGVRFPNNCDGYK